jgi:hypothetical protein
MGLGVFYVQQRRALDHAEFSIRNAPTSVKRINDLAISCLRD